MNVLLGCIALIAAVIVAIWYGKAKQNEEDDARLDAAEGKAAESDIRAQVAREEAALAKEADAIAQEIHDETLDTAPGVERIAARWDLLRRPAVDDRPPSPGSDPDKVH